MSETEFRDKADSGLNLILKPSIATWITVAVLIIGSIIGFTRFADSKTSREDVERIVEDRIKVALAPIVVQVSVAVSNTEEIKGDLKELRKIKNQNYDR